MSNVKNIERIKQAYEMRQQGMYFSEIGAALGVSESRAQTMVKQYEFELQLMEMQAAEND